MHLFGAPLFQSFSRGHISHKHTNSCLSISHISYLNGLKDKCQCFGTIFVICLLLKESSFSSFNLLPKCPSKILAGKLSRETMM